MASFLDTGLLGLFKSLFAFVLVYLVFWGVLIAREPFGKDKKGLYAIIALMVAFLVAVSAPAKVFLEFVAPWFTILAVALFFIFLVFSVFGNVDGGKVIRDTTVQTWLIIFSVLILASGLAWVFGQGLLNMQMGEEPVPALENETLTGGTPVYASNGMPMPGVVGPTATPNFQTNLINIIVHPKVLGLLVVFILSAIIIYFLTRPTSL